MTPPTSVDFDVHQEDDVVASTSVVRVAVVAGFIGALGVVCSGILLVASSGSLRPTVAGPTGPGRREFAIAGVEQTPIRDARRGLDLRAAQKRELEHWGWIDRSAGVATISIETAMDLVVEKSR